MRTDPSISAAEYNRLALQSITEADVEAEITDWSKLQRGLLMLRTVEHRKRCPSCGEFLHSGSGIDKGVPDRLARLDDFPIPGLLIGLECKRPYNWRWSSPEQRKVNERGGSVVVHSSVDVERVLLEASRLLRRIG
jgi:hypothetical protein